MTDFYLLNEVVPGHNPELPGAIEVYPSAKAIEDDLEPWYVNETYLLIGQNGKRRALKDEKGLVRLTSSDDQTDYSGKLKELLVHHLNSADPPPHHKKKLSGVGSIDFSSFPTDALFKLSLLLG
jgi:hypothetical protein